MLSSFLLYFLVSIHIPKLARRKQGEERRGRRRRRRKMRKKKMMMMTYANDIFREPAEGMARK